MYCMVCLCGSAAQDLSMGPVHRAALEQQRERAKGEKVLEAAVSHGETSELIIRSVQVSLLPCV